MQRPLSALLLAVFLTRAVGAFAQEPPAPATIEQAKRYFEEGESLRAAGQYQAALEAYLKSRSLVGRATNTVNAAVCLYALKRYDEAYEYFEEALTKYPESQLPPETRESAKKTMADIEAKVGRLDVSANVDGTVVVDGRARAKLPLVAPIRLMPGKHLVRVLRDGFATFEQSVDIRERETSRIDAKLEPLTSAGRLRIEAPPELEGADVFIDGANVGVIPWEGTLAPGSHVYAVVKGDVGTGPRLAAVVVGQTVKVSVAPKPLGPERRIVVDPLTADLFIDGVAVGKGRFQGRLTVGEHVVEAREVGYVSARVVVKVDAKGASDIPVKLAIDPRHPRWKTGPTGHFAIEVDAAAAIPLSWGGDIAGSCTGSCKSSPSVGGSALLHAGYNFGSGFGFGLHAGYLRLSEKLASREDKLFPVGRAPISASLDDSLRLSGLSVGVDAAVRFYETWPLRVRFGAGAFFASVTDSRTGHVVDSDGVAHSVSVNHTANATLLYLAPEARFGRRIGERLILDVGAQLLVLAALNTPRWDATKTVSAGPTDGLGVFAASSIIGGISFAASVGLGATYEF